MSRFKTLGTRAMTATIFALVMIAGIYLHPAGFMLLFGIILIIGLNELFELSFYADIESKKLYKNVGPFISALPFLWVVFDKLGIFKFKIDPFIALTLFLIPVFIGFLIELLLKGRQQFYRVSYVALGVAYLCLPISLVCDLAINDEGFHPNVIMGLLFLIWINDTGAYFAGSAFGKHKLYETISPGKTWEGSLGGAVLTMAVAWLFPLIFGEFESTQWVVLGIISMIFGTLGDLTESMLKRNHGVKDSGSLMPGHGGILDRFDAFIFLIPFAYLYIKLFIHKI